MDKNEKSGQGSRQPFTAEQIRKAAAPQSVPYTPNSDESHIPWWQRLLKGAAWITWFVGPAAPPPSTLEDMHNQKRKRTDPR